MLEMGGKVRNDRPSAFLRRCKAAEPEIKAELCTGGWVAFRYYLRLL